MYGIEAETTGELLGSTDDPYLIEERTLRIRHYNPAYGDERKCACGHSYYRHFDTYEEMEAVGCKYCECIRFISAEVRAGKDVRYKGTLEPPPPR
jgi:hypothetical protein